MWENSSRLCELTFCPDKVRRWRNLNSLTFALSSVPSLRIAGDMEFTVTSGKHLGPLLLFPLNENLSQALFSRTWKSGQIVFWNDLIRPNLPPCWRPHHTCAATDKSVIFFLVFSYSWLFLFKWTFFGCVFYLWSNVWVMNRRKVSPIDSGQDKYLLLSPAWREPCCTVCSVAVKFEELV